MTAHTRRPRPTPIPIDLSEGETLELGPGTQDIHPELWGLLYDYARGIYMEHRGLTLAIGESDNSQAGESLDDFISSVRGQERDEGGSWYVPIDYVIQVVQRQDTETIDWLNPTGEVFFMTHILGEFADDPLYERDDVLIKVLRASITGVPDSEAAQYSLYADGDRILVQADARDARNQKQIRTWLFGRGIYSIPSHPTKRPDDFTVVAMVPVSELHSLMETFDMVRFEAHDIRDYNLPISRAWWSDDSVQNEKSVVARTIGGLGQYTTLLIDEYGLIDRQQAVQEAVSDDFARHIGLDSHSEATKGGAMTLLDAWQVLYSEPVRVPREYDEDQLVWLVVFEGEIDESQRDEDNTRTLRPEQLVIILDAKTGEFIEGSKSGGYHGVNTEGLEDLTSYFDVAYTSEPTPTPTPMLPPTPEVGPDAATRGVAYAERV